MYYNSQKVFDLCSDLMAEPAISFPPELPRILIHHFLKSEKYLDPIQEIFYPIVHITHNIKINEASKTNNSFYY